MGGNLLQEGNGTANNVARLYVHGGRVDEIVASQGGGAWRYHHYDARNNCILLTGSNGTLLEQYDYDAFGFPYFHKADGSKQGPQAYGTGFSLLAVNGWANCDSTITATGCTNRS